jgi:hypothetical protein
VGTTAEAIRWYEAVFFNVRLHLNCDDWINSHIFHPALWTRSYFSYAVRLNAYYSGVAAVELLLNSTVDRQQPAGEYPRTQEELEAYLQENAVSHVAKTTILVSQFGLVATTSVDELLKSFQGILASANAACEASKRLRPCVKGDRSEALTPNESISVDNAGVGQTNDTRGHEVTQQRRSKKLANLDALIARTVWQYRKANESS